MTGKSSSLAGDCLPRASDAATGLIGELTRSGIRQLWYAPVLTVAIGLMMARMLIMARLLDVQSFAQFSAGLLVSSTFCMLGCLGLQFMLQREWPVNLIRGQERRGLIRAAQCNLLSLACVAAGLLAAAFGLSPARIPPQLLAVGVLHGLSQQMLNIATVESRSRGEALRFSQQYLLRALAVVAAGAAVAVSTSSGVATLGIEALISITISAGIFQQAVRRAALRTCEIYDLAIRRMGYVQWFSAITLMAVMGVSFILQNADRWVAADQLGAERFAHYSFAWIVLMIAQSVQVVLNASLYPTLARRFARGGRLEAFRACVLASLGMLILGAICTAPLWFAFDIGVRRWFPIYQDAMYLLPWFLIVAVVRVSDYWSSYLLIVGREAQLLAINVASAVAGISAWAALIRPWQRSELQPYDVALLAVVLTIVSYGGAVGLAWRARVA
jgi:O-antigen/teichoic acid export membrane protein